LLCCKGGTGCGISRYNQRESLLRFVKLALAVAETELPTYSHRFAPHRYTLAQLCACCLVKVLLRRALGRSERGHWCGGLPERMRASELPADAGYEAEWVAQWCREDHGIESWIPPAVHRRDGKVGGRWRKVSRENTAGAGVWRPSSLVSSAPWRACCKHARLLVSWAKLSNALWSTASLARRGPVIFPSWANHS